eukprot:3597283-Rhodomonas_salina.1
MANVGYMQSFALCHTHAAAMSGADIDWLQQPASGNRDDRAGLRPFMATLLHHMLTLLPCMDAKLP